MRGGEGVIATMTGTTVVVVVAAVSAAAPRTATSAAAPPTAPTTGGGGDATTTKRMSLSTTDASAETAPVRMSEIAMISTGAEEGMRTEIEAMTTETETVAALMTDTIAAKRCDAMSMACYAMCVCLNACCVKTAYFDIFFTSGSPAGGNGGLRCACWVLGDKRAAADLLSGGFSSLAYTRPHQTDKS